MFSPRFAPGILVLVLMLIFGYQFLVPDKRPTQLVFVITTIEADSVKVCVLGWRGLGKHIESVTNAPCGWFKWNENRAMGVLDLREATLSNEQKRRDTTN